MAEYEAKPNTITIFENKNRNSDKSPHLNGNMRVSLDDLSAMPVVMVADKDGKMHRCIDLDVSLWSKAKGDFYFWSGSVKKKYVKGDGGAENANFVPPHTGRDHSEFSDGTEFFNQTEAAPAAPPPDDPGNDLPF